MVLQNFTDGPWKGLMQIHLGLTPKEIDVIQAFATNTWTWVDGRQKSGYYKLDLKVSPLSREPLEFHVPRERLFVALRQYIGDDADISAKTTDYWLLYYPEGGNVPWHNDPAPKGKRHVRANLAVTTPADGGEFVVENGFYEGAMLKVALSPGAGIVFEATRSHSVNRVGLGGRLMLSVGTVF
jgi:predicted 2-oxoglutarate/Fe(II)-dependent dioxygenase YbiX